MSLAKCCYSNLQKIKLGLGDSGLVFDISSRINSTTLDTEYKSTVSICYKKVVLCLRDESLTDPKGKLRFDIVCYTKSQE